MAPVEFPPNQVSLLYGCKPAAHTQLLVVKSPTSWQFRKVVGLSILFVLLAIPLLGLILRGSSPCEHESANIKLLPVLFHDLVNEGLLKTGAKSLVVSGAADLGAIESLVVSDNELDLISVSDFEGQSAIPEDTFDFAFVNDFSGASTFIDRILKVGGIAVVQLNNDDSISFDQPPNYRVVYLWGFDSTVVAMRKTHHSQTASQTRRRLFGLPMEAKRAALKNLEDVFLEPPGSGSRKSRSYLKRTKYLPDLTGDSLEGYPRRVFIHVGPPGRDDGKTLRWFKSYYPTRNRNFEMYNVVIKTEESKGMEEAEMGMSEWLRKNVKEDEYVVMKAEAEVVEEMVKSKAIGLVDELFLECKPQSPYSRKSKKVKRAYWECLALYGQLRDEGVAVHQWWG